MKQTQQKYDTSSLPMNGDTLHVSHVHGAKNDPVRLIQTNYSGNALVRYEKSKGIETRMKLFNDRNMSFSIHKSVYSYIDNFI